MSLCLNSKLIRHTNAGQLYQCKKMKNLRKSTENNAVLDAWKEVADQLDFIGDSKLFILSEIYTKISGWCSSKLVFKNRRYV